MAIIPLCRLKGDPISSVSFQTNAIAVVENARGGYRCFLGLFDPSARPWVGQNELSFTVPMSRFTTMLDTMRQCFLFGSHAWEKVKARL